MNKIIEKIFFGFLFILVLYNLIYYDIFEGNRMRKMMRRRRIVAKLQIVTIACWE